MRLLVTFLALGLFANITFLDQLRASEEIAYIDPYVVENVEVDVSAESSSTARPQAISLAQRKAFAVLLTRFESNTSLDSLTTLEDKDLEKIVQDIEIKQEKFSAVRYRAVFIVRFNQQAFAAFLSNQGHKNSAVEEKAIDQKGWVLIPIIDMGFKALLWEEENQLLAHFQTSFEVYKNLDLLVPAGDLVDMQKLPLDAAQCLDQNRILSFLDHYKIPRALVVRFRKNENFIDLIRVDRDGMTPLASERMTETDLNQRLPVLIQKTVGVDLDPMAPSQSQGSFEQITLVIPPLSFTLWTEMQKNLRNSPMVRHVRVLELSPQGARIRLDLKGREGTLKSVLQGVGIQGAWPNLKLSWRSTSP